MRRLSPAQALVAALLLAIPLLLTAPALLGGRAFVPADLLQHVAPWKRETPDAAWNVLRFDGITQFYPWRLAAARSYRSGKLPLWNPNQLASGGGTPLWANSQSAPLYPLNLPFWVLPTWYAFGLGAAFHLLIAAMGVYRLARSLGLERPASALSATAFALSGPVVCWLALPTFLCVSAWLPWLLLAIRRNSLVRAGLTLGLALLGGHLQIALYVALSGLVYAAFHIPATNRGRVGLGALGALALAGLLAAPQALPSVELSKISARASAGKPTLESYSGWVKSAMPIRSLVTLAFPDFYGHPIDGTHWNDSEVGGRVAGGNNYAEWACYVGVAPLILALAALFFPWKRADEGVLKERRPLAALLGLSLALALGSPLNLVTYFGIPGFSQTGNPARVLVVAALALSLLAGIGVQLLADAALSLALRRRALALGVGTAVFLAAIGASQSVGWAALVRPDVPFGKLLDLAMPGILLGVVWLALTVVLGFAGTKRTDSLPQILLICLTLVDLGVWASRYNPTAPPAEVYPVTPGLRWLQENAQGALIAPLNQSWSMGAPSPRAVLPPNALTVYGLRDVSGYDSLFPGERKDALKSVLGRDPSPPENGNMVFVKGIEEARAAGAALVVTRPDDAPLSLSLAYDGPDLRVYRADWPTPPPPSPPPPTTALKVGLFLGALGMATLGGLIVGESDIPRRIVGIREWKIRKTSY